MPSEEEWEHGDWKYHMDKEDDVLTEEGKRIRDIRERRAKDYHKKTRDLAEDDGPWFYVQVWDDALNDIDWLLRDRERLCRKANDALDENLLLKATVGYARKERFNHRTDPNL